MKSLLLGGMILRARMKETHTVADGKVGVFRGFGAFFPEIRISHLGTLL